MIIIQRRKKNSGDNSTVLWNRKTEAFDDDQLVAAFRLKNLISFIYKVCMIFIAEILKMAVSGPAPMDLERDS